MWRLSVCSKQVVAIPGRRVKRRISDAPVRRHVGVCPAGGVKGIRGVVRGMVLDVVLDGGLLERRHGEVVGEAAARGECRRCRLRIIDLCKH